MRRIGTVVVGLVFLLTLTLPAQAHWGWDHLKTGSKSCGPDTMLTRIHATFAHRHLVNGSSRYDWGIVNRVSVKYWSAYSGSYELMSDWALAWVPGGTYTECND